MAAHTSAALAQAATVSPNETECRSSEPLSPETGPIMTVGDVERMLDDTPRDGTRREGGATLLTDSYDFSELERREAGERPAAAMDQTAPIPLDLSDWGDATPLRVRLPNGAVVVDADEELDVLCRRLSAERRTKLTIVYAG